MGTLRSYKLDRVMLCLCALLIGAAGCAPARRTPPAAPLATTAAAAVSVGSAAATATDEATSTAAAPAAMGDAPATSTLAAATTPGAEVRVRPIPAAVNIRRGPGTSFEVVAILRGEETARVVAHEGSGAWFNVVTDAGISGWVAANVVAVVSGDAGQIGVAAMLPGPLPATAQLAPPATATLAPESGGQNPPPKPPTPTTAPTVNPAMTPTPSPKPTGYPEPTGYPGPTGYPEPTINPVPTETVNPYP